MTVESAIVLIEGSSDVVVSDIAPESGHSFEGTHVRFKERIATSDSADPANQVHSYRRFVNPIGDRNFQQIDHSRTIKRLEPR